MVVTEFTLFLLMISVGVYEYLMVWRGYGAARESCGTGGVWSLVVSRYLRDVTEIYAVKTDGAREEPARRLCFTA